MTEAKKRSPWVWVASGCGALVLIVVLVFAGLAYFGYRTVKRMQAEMADPVARTEKAKQILGAETLPEGYQVVWNFSLPTVLDMTVLGDREPDWTGGGDSLDRFFERTGFVYVETMRGKDEQKLRAIVEGQASPADLFRGNEAVRLDSRETLGNGVVELDGWSAGWLAQRGTLTVAKSRVSGLVTLLHVRCPDDSRQRTAVWFAKEPEDGDLTGSQADPEAIAAFLGHFAPCRP